MLRESRVQVLARFTGVFYFVAFLLLVSPWVELAFGVAPLRPLDIQWRYTSSALMSRSLLTSLAGAVMYAAIAVCAGHHRIQRSTGFVSSIVGGFVLVVSAIFLRDIVEMLGNLPSDQHLAFEIVSLRALALDVAAGSAFLWVGTVAVRTSEVQKKKPRPRPDRGSMVNFPKDDERDESTP